MNITLFPDLNFSVIDSPEFKEDSVREAIILPILTRLGYSTSGKNRIIRGKALEHPFVRIGTKKHKIYIFPDYILCVQGEPKWILDAKAPNQEIHKGKNVEQAYSYAIHREVRVNRYALCNGKEFVVFRIDDNEQPILDFRVSEIDDYLSRLHGLLSVQSFIAQPEKEEQPLHFQVEDEVYVFVEKKVGVLWSNRLDIPVRKERKQFKGKFLADAGKYSVKTVTGYELYLLPNGRYLVYVHRNHNLGDWVEAYLAGFDTKGMVLQEVQNEFPIVASQAGLSPVEILDVD